MLQKLTIKLETTIFGAENSADTLLFTPDKSCSQAWKWIFFSVSQWNQ